MKNTLTTQAAVIAKFKSDCEAKLNSGTNKIPFLPSASQILLRQNTEDARALMNKTLQTQQDFLARFQQSLTSHVADTRSDPRALSSSLAKSIAILEGNRKQIDSTLDNLNTMIEEAYKKTPQAKIGW